MQIFNEITMITKFRHSKKNVSVYNHVVKLGENDQVDIELRKSTEQETIIKAECSLSVKAKSNPITDKSMLAADNSATKELNILLFIMPLTLLIKGIVTALKLILPG